MGSAEETATGEAQLIVINRNGQKTVITGWREGVIWLAVAAAIVVIGGLALGFALTLFSVALIALPIAIVLVLLSSLFMRP